MSKIFDNDSDSEPDFKANNEYAKNYNNWRKKEVLNTLITKYGEENLNFDADASSTSSSDDEDGVEITDEVEKQFLKTLCYLKTKDPKIYDKNSVFFEDKQSELDKNKPKKDKPVYIKDYERQLILEQNGIPIDENAEIPHSPPRNEADQDIVKDIKFINKSVTEDNDDFLAKRKESKSTNDEDASKSNYKDWLAGQTDEIDDTDIANDLKPLKDMWSDPKLNPKEKFLRDFILKNRYLENVDENYIPTYDEIIHDSDENLSHDEEEIAKQEEFEHKYNFRFEEPDQDFIKRYPRTVENSLRRTDDRRKVKRAEVKERKKLEKESKMEELNKLKELKRKEIEEKLEKLKEITKDSVGFQDDDVDGDFDPEAHDRRMQALFNEEFYQGHEDDQKPEFRDIDEELEIENWDKWDKNDTTSNNEAFEPSDNKDMHCEDVDFIMDADYDPTAIASTSNEIGNEMARGKRKRRRKSKFALAVGKPKPKFDPNDKNFEKYFEEYYKLDCEDIIGDIPCRFKYREVIPNSFGLSTEEILLAKDRELNKWCSLKKAVQLRPDHVEKYEQQAYSNKGKNVELKKKILPSLFAPDPEEDENIDETNDNINEKKLDDTNQTEADANEINNINEETNQSKKKDLGNDKTKDNNIEIKEMETKSNTKKSKNKIKKKKKKNTSEAELVNKPDIEDDENNIIKEIETKINNTKPKKKKNKKIKSNDLTGENAENNKADNTKNKTNGENSISKKKKKKNRNVGDKEEIANNKVITNKEIQNRKRKISEQNTANENPIKKKKKNKKTGVTNESNKYGIKLINERTNKHLEDNNKTTKKTKNKNVHEKDPMNNISDSRLAAYGINPKKFKNKLKYKQKV